MAMGSQATEKTFSAAAERFQFELEIEFAKH